MDSKSILYIRKTEEEASNIKEWLLSEEMKGRSGAEFTKLNFDQDGLYTRENLISSIYYHIWIRTVNNSIDVGYERDGKYSGGRGPIDDFIFGSLREASNNVIPPSIAHAGFDIVVYGGYITSPVWV